MILHCILLWVRLSSHRVVCSVTFFIMRVLPFLFQVNITTDMSKTEEPEPHLYIRISAALWKYLPLFFLVWGTISNILSFIVFSTKAMRNSLTSFLFRVLSVLDLSMLYSHSWAAMLYYIFRINTFTINDSTCSIFSFWMAFSKISAAWVLVLIGFERLISVCIPHRVKIICSKKKAIVALIVIAFVALITELPPVFSIKLESYMDSKGNIVQRICTYSSMGSYGIKYYTKFIWPWLDFMMYTGIPFVLMMCFNIAIISKLCMAAVKRRNATSQASDDRSGLSGLTGMLLSVSFAFLVLTIPMTLNYFRPTSLSDDQFYLVHTVAFMCIYTNHSSNFLFYCIGGSRFRQVLKDTISCSKSSNYN